MKILTAVRDFMEKYDEEAMGYISECSHQFGRIYRKDTINLFNLKESCDMFIRWLNGYTNYFKEGNEVPADIKESCAKFLESDQMFQESAYTYDRFPTFVQDYLEGVQEVISAIEECKTAMQEADIEPELIGNVNGFADEFMDKLTESFDPAMDKLLTVSGYKTRKWLDERRVPKKKAVFL